MINEQLIRLEQAKQEFREWKEEYKSKMDKYGLNFAHDAYEKLQNHILNGVPIADIEEAHILIAYIRHWLGWAANEGEEELDLRDIYLGY